GVADHAAVDVQAADAGIRRAEHLMGDAGRNPYRAQRRRDEAATVGTYLEHPFHRMGQLHPGMAVAIAELEVGRRIELAIDRPSQLPELAAAGDQPSLVPDCGPLLPA